MSADNYLGIYKVNNRRYIARSCFSEYVGNCNKCSNRIIFIAKSLSEAAHKAKDEINNPGASYEYGYRFLN